MPSDDIFSRLSVESLKEALRIREEIATRQSRLAEIEAASAPVSSAGSGGTTKGGNLLRRFEKEITGVAGVATALAAIVAAVGLVLTSCQLKDSRRAFEATTVYNIQKDGRDLAWDIRQNHADAHDYIFRYNPTNSYSAATVSNAELAIVKIVQFYSSVYNQRIDGVISEQYWPAFENEISNVINTPPMATFWTNRVIKGAFSAEFKKFGTDCLAKGTNH